MPRCLLCSTNEEVRLNKWENNYVCLKLHLLYTPESWHAFQLPAPGRQMGKSTRLHYRAIVPKNTSPDWSESGEDLSEWIWVTRFIPCFPLDDFGICSKWVDVEGRHGFQKHPDAEKHCTDDYVNTDILANIDYWFTTLLMTILSWSEVSAWRSVQPCFSRMPCGHWQATAPHWASVSSLLHEKLGLDDFWGPFQVSKQKNPTNDLDSKRINGL